jgi:hypothetical protein
MIHLIKDRMQINGDYFKLFYHPHDGGVQVFLTESLEKNIHVSQLGEMHTEFLEMCAEVHRRYPDAHLLKPGDSK